MEEESDDESELDDPEEDEDLSLSESLELLSLDSSFLFFVLLFENCSDFCFSAALKKMKNLLDCPCKER